jgi:hypothetical protein
MFRILWLVAASLLLAAGLIGCDSTTPPTPVPPVDVRATAVNDRLVAEQTLVALKNATSTVTSSEFQRIKPLLQVSLKDAGSAAPGETQVEVTVTNGDRAAHRIVIRLYDRAQPLNAAAYAIGAVEVGPGAAGTTVVTAPLPFAAVAAQIQQIDGTWDFGPPAPYHRHGQYSQGYVGVRLVC